MSESFAEMFEESLKNTVMTVGEVIKAEVVSVDGDYVTVTAGLKSEAEIPLSQFAKIEGEYNVHAGDLVEVAIESVEDGYGRTKLSHDKARRVRVWAELEKAHENEDIVVGQITGKVKGGFTVSLQNVRAFLPGSLVDVRPVKDSAYLENRDLELKVIKIDKARNNVVVSRRAVVENELGAEREELLKTIEEGQIVKGIVKNLTDYGAFINLGGIDGLLHITDMAWKRVKHPSEILEVGQDIEARVLKFDKEKARVSLGIKQMGDDPWKDLARRFTVDSRHYGKVTNITDYGAFVELEDGVEGLVHVSEMDWTNKNIHPSKVCQVNDEVEVVVLEIDAERRRISLGMKQCRANPWDSFAATHKKGDKVVGKIKSITDFGVFIGLEGNIDGLIHLSDLSWNEEGEDVIRNYSKGDELEAVVLAVDPERERISLGVKQISGDPFSDFVAANNKGAVVTGTVKEVDSRGVTIELTEGVEGYLRAGEISRDHVDDASNLFSVGDKVESKVTSIDRKTRRISLSIKALEAQHESEAIQEYARGSDESGSSLLAEKLKEKLNK
ncbi:30S ribosomal protein S1 [Arenicella chitinivorans]|uniref:Small ribosomal subunit protein bS1 n=1 Tax=Arenicella chitinivorans TaxID=1329800 RepID=A0A918RLC8_9GAMM|nr:30S ribosomal protein S1 [Arenicella chitinivorans]GGZ99441.1 30S ribosomal protein S1 [Arenicella chitinivorans]